MRLLTCTLLTLGLVIVTCAGCGYEAKPTSKPTTTTVPSSPGPSADMPSEPAATDVTAPAGDQPAAPADTPPATEEKKPVEAEKPAEPAKPEEK